MVRIHYTTNNTHYSEWLGIWELDPNTKAWDKVFMIETDEGKQITDKQNIEAFRLGLLKEKRL